MINFERVPRFIKNEIEARSNTLKEGARGKNVKRVQEWLDVHKFYTSIDGDFGPATRSALKDFQKSKGLTESGRVDKKTWAQLCSPMSRALIAPAVTNKSVPQLIRLFARRHLKEHPKEIGGQNCGPWVRLYCSGNDGSQWAWCAGFVTLILNQASFYSGTPPVIKGSVSCDTLAAQAKAVGAFISGQDVRSGKLGLDSSNLPLIFLKRKTEGDWTHTGFVISAEGKGTDTVFITIEGNTNSAGHREGYEACERRRSLSKYNYDFIRCYV